MKRLGGIAIFAGFLGFCWMGYNIVEVRKKASLKKNLTVQIESNETLQAEVNKLKKQLEECNIIELEETEDDSN